MKLWNWLCSWEFGYDTPAVNGILAILLILMIVGLIIDGCRGKKSIFF